jgi:hypothetical protein
LAQGEYDYRVVSISFEVSSPIKIASEISTDFYFVYSSVAINSSFSRRGTFDSARPCSN